MPCKGNFPKSRHQAAGCLLYTSIVVIAFGQILPERILNLPKYGCINIHASLLPKYRGAAPIQWAVINGDEVSGVTTMQMDVGLDTGDILDTVEVRLDPKETGGSLFDRLSLAGGKLILSTLEKAEAGILHPVKQDEAEATHVTMLDKSMGQIDWSMDAAVIERLIRGLNPWPSAYTKFEGKTLKIWSADVEEDAAGRPSPETFGQVVRCLLYTSRCMEGRKTCRMRPRLMMIGPMFRQREKIWHRIPDRE